MGKFSEVFPQTAIGEGAAANVRLSSKERLDLVAKYGEDATAAKIDDLSHYLMRRPKRYKSHYWVLRDWMRLDKTVQAFTPPPTPAPSLLDEMEVQHRAACLQRVRIREGLTPNDIESCLRAIRELDGDRRG